MASFLFLSYFIYGGKLLGIIKGDVRYAYLSQMIPDSVLSGDLKDLYGIDSLLLPFGGIAKDYKIRQSNLNLLDILRINRIKTIYVGNANDELRKICDEEKIKLYEILKDRKFVQENAFLTAIGLLHLLQRSDKSIQEEKVWILGYGNIGFYLAKMLRMLHVSFSVYTEEEIEKKYATLEGYALEDFPKDHTLIINTIPKNLDIDYRLLKNKRIVDVSSSPYGFDLNRIEEEGIEYEILSAIPSKYAAGTAGKLIKNFIDFHQ